MPGKRLFMEVSLAFIDLVNLVVEVLNSISITAKGSGNGCVCAFRAHFDLVYTVLCVLVRC